mgnify:CR=1 FL=1
MEFDANKPIYLQISDVLCDKILSGELKEGDRIQSVREWGAQIGVNPNTVARSYDFLTERGVIFNKRGIGFFIAEGAKDAVLKEEKRIFVEEELPSFRKRADLLGIDLKELL